MISNLIKKLTNKVSQNSIMVLQPYRDKGVWAFDDPTTGLVREPFVLGIPEIIETALETNGIPVNEAVNGFNLYFSASPFPGKQVSLTWIAAENGGNWYRCEETQQVGWLCPALFKYFAKAPKQIFAKCEKSK